MERGILVQRSMNPHFIVVGTKLDEDPAQMCLTEQENMYSKYKVNAST